MKQINIISRLVVCLVFIAPFPAIFAQDFWKSMNGPKDGAVFSLVIKTSGDVFAANRGGVYHLPDNGVNWSKVLTSNYVRALAISPNGVFLQAETPEFFVRRIMVYTG